MVQLVSKEQPSLLTLLQLFQKNKWSGAAFVVNLDNFFRQPIWIQIICTKRKITKIKHPKDNNTIRLFKTLDYLWNKQCNWSDPLEPL